MILKLTQKNFNGLIEGLNHRVTSIEQNMIKLSNDSKWMRRIGYYMATLLTAILIKSVFIG